MLTGRQEIVLSIESFKEMALNVAKDFLNNSNRTKFQELISLIKKYHILVIDESNDGSHWLKELNDLLIKLRTISGGGPLVRDIINQDLLNTSNECYFKKCQIQYHKDYKELCENLSNNTFYKIYVTDNLSTERDLNIYKIDEFCNTDKFRKGCVLLRRMKSFDFESGDDTKRLISLAPYVKHSKYLNIYDAFLFKSISDWEIISLIISYCDNLESVNFYSKFYKRREGELRNYIDSLESNYPEIKFSTKKYNFATDHHREIKSDEFEIILDNSFMNFIFENDDTDGRVLVEKSVNLTFR